jgi:hypothetical protein
LPNSGFTVPQTTISKKREKAKLPQGPTVVCKKFAKWEISINEATRFENGPMIDKRAKYSLRQLSEPLGCPT